MALHRNTWFTDFKSCHTPCHTPCHMHVICMSYTMLTPISILRAWTASLTYIRNSGGDCEHFRALHLIQTWVFHILSQRKYSDLGRVCSRSRRLPSKLDSANWCLYLVLCTLKRRVAENEFEKYRPNALPENLHGRTTSFHMPLQTVYIAPFVSLS